MGKVTLAAAVLGILTLTPFEPSCAGTRCTLSPKNSADQAVELCTISGHKANPHCPDTLTVQPTTLKSENTCAIHAVAVQGPYPNVKQLTSGPGDAFDPAFLPDGRILFASNRDGNNEIYVMDADGTDIKRLTNNSFDDQAPSPGPGGTITFQSKRHGQWDIFLINSDGSEEKQLTVDAAEDTHPTLGPNNKIIFASSRHSTVQIFAMNLDGSNVRRLTNSDYSVSSPSANRERVVFTSQATTQTEANPNAGEPAKPPNHDVFIMFADGFAPQRLTRNSNKNHQAAISASGTIVFTSNRDGNPEIYAMSADASKVRRLTNHQAVDELPAISSKGDIVFVANRNGQRAVYRLE